jgi:hypothetical protein
LHRLKFLGLVDKLQNSYCQGYHDYPKTGQSANSLQTNGKAKFLAKTNSDTKIKELRTGLDEGLYDDLDKRNCNYNMDEYMSKNNLYESAASC